MSRRDEDARGRASRSSRVSYNRSVTANVRLTLDLDASSSEAVRLTRLLGLLDLVERGVVHVDDAECVLLNPFRNTRPAALGVRPEVLELLEASFFLGDTWRLGDASFCSTLKQLREDALKCLTAESPAPLRVRLSVEGT